MKNMRRLVFALWASFSAVTLFAAAPSNAQRSYSTYDFAKLEDGAEAAQNYREKAQVRLGPEKRLTNGVSWRLLIDMRTGVAMPRVTWMPNRTSLLAANRWFEALHGAAIEDAYKAEAGVLSTTGPGANGYCPDLCQ